MHIIHQFDKDFYGEAIRIIVAGYIRPEQNYPSLGKNEFVKKWKNDWYMVFLDALIRDIKTDIEVAKHSLKREAYSNLRNHPLFNSN